MNTKISSVRELFKRGSVVTGADGFTIVYSNLKHWVHDSITGEGLQHLSGFFETANAVTIIVKPADSVQIRFEIDNFSLTSEEYPPLKAPVVFDSAIVSTDYTGCDISSDEISAFVELLDNKLNDAREKILDEQRTARWPVMKKTYNNILSSGLNCESELVEPDPGLLYGVVKMSFTTDTWRSIEVLSGEKLHLVLDLIQISDEVALEVDAGSGVLNIEFFA